MFREGAASNPGRKKSKPIGPEALDDADSKLLGRPRLRSPKDRQKPETSQRTMLLLLYIMDYQYVAIVL